MFSFMFFDSYGNVADTSATFAGVRVSNQASLVVSNSFFLASGKSGGMTDVSSVIYSSGNNSISILQGTYGELFLILRAFQTYTHSFKFFFR